MEKISLNVTLAEAVKSSSAAMLDIENVPDATNLENMKRVAENVFEPLRREVCGNKPLAITSFFRSPELNKNIGGSVNSQHCRGEAMDIDADTHGNGNNKAIFEYIRDCLEFDQLIWEFGDGNQPAWVHVSLCAAGNRHQVLRAYKTNGKTTYKLL